MPSKGMSSTWRWASSSGAAFGQIVDSLVRQIIMPLLSVLLPSQQSYVGWKWVIDGKEVPYGLFLSEVLNFVIVAATLFFFVVNFLGWVMKTKKAEAVTLPALTKDQELLSESVICSGQELLDLNWTKTHPRTNCNQPRGPSKSRSPRASSSSHSSISGQSTAQVPKSAMWVYDSSRAIVALIRALSLRKIGP